MLERFPKFYEDFHCLGGACPHTCCALWEVVLDEDTVAAYRLLPGDLGDRLRAAMTEDQDGDVCFPLNGGRCPFLDGDNLCEIHRTLGEAATSVTCQEHPRFIEDYGPFRELTLSASCPEANRLLFASPFALAERETDEEGEEGDDWLAGLLPFRATLLELLADGGRPIHDRLRDLLLLSCTAQALLEDEDLEALAALTPADCPELEMPQGPGLFPEALEVLEELERLEANWTDVLAAARPLSPAPGPDPELQRVAEYGCFRYLLKCVNDGDLLSRAQLCVFLTLAAERLAPVCGSVPEALRRLSCEVEHSDCNLDALLEAFRWDPVCSVERMLTELSVK